MPGWVAGWLSDYTATLWPILQAETCQIFSQAEIQDRPSVAKSSADGTLGRTYIIQKGGARS